MTINYPVVKIKSIGEIENHPCMRVREFQVCMCAFEFPCPVCGEIQQVVTQTGAKHIFTYGCYNCIKKKNKKSLGVNHNKIIDSNSWKEGYLTGKDGENHVAKCLVDRGYRVFKPYLDNNPDFDLVVTKNNKYAEIQVKATKFNHNNYIAFGGKNVFYSPIEKVRFDFLIVDMISYNTFFIVPKKYLTTQSIKHNSKHYASFRANCYQIGWEKSRYFPFENAWHLIDEFFKQ